MGLFSFKPKKKVISEKLYKVTLEDVSKEKEQPDETMMVSQEGEQR
jgi:hypothetical protein